jgi:hypothetical protein
MTRGIQMMNECQLAGFRTCELAPARLYGQIPANGEVVLIPLPPGIGKSRAAQALVGHALEHDHDLVIYVAPTRGIIDEIQLVRRLPAESVVSLKPRPGWLCGAADMPWKDFERSGCAALARATLCESCVERDANGGDCSWPDQLDQIGPATRLVVMTEQYLLLNPLLLREIRARVGCRRALLILDEALFTTTAVVRRFTRSDLRRFRNALAEARQKDTPDTGIEAWLEGIDFLLDHEVELAALRRFWSNRLNRNVLAAQAAGYQAFGSSFRYLATELELVNSEVTTGQWRDGETFEIVVRVDTIGCDVVIMAPYLDPEIVEERLSRPVIRLFSNLVFRHSDSRIINIADPIGTANTLAQPEHFNRIVDFFLALVLRNVGQGWRTVLVTRKKFLNRVKARIEQVSAEIGRPLTCVLASSGKPFDRCGPAEIALINYGIVGVNSLESFDAVYCIGGYYARADHLNAVYQQTLPPDSRLPIGVRMEGRRRQVYAADGEFNTRFHAKPPTLPDCPSPGALAAP